MHALALYPAHPLTFGLYSLLCRALYCSTSPPRDAQLLRSFEPPAGGRSVPPPPVLFWLVCDIQPQVLCLAPVQ